MSASSSVPLPAAVSTATKTETVLAVEEQFRLNMIQFDEKSHNCIEIRRKNLNN